MQNAAAAIGGADTAFILFLDMKFFSSIENHLSFDNCQID